MSKNIVWLLMVLLLSSAHLGCVPDKPQTRLPEERSFLSGLVKLDEDRRKSRQEWELLNIGSYCRMSVSTIQKYYPQCAELAIKGDRDIAYNIAMHHRTLNQGKEAAEWYKRSADMGHAEAMKEIFNIYYYGRGVPKNETVAEEYLNRALTAESEWAQLVTAKRIETTEPSRSLEFYLAVARRDNCFAQARLAQIYYEGHLAERNQAQAYFWALLASVENRKSDYHALAGIAAHPTAWSCSAPAADFALLTKKIERSLSPESRRLAQSAASTWTRGEKEGYLSDVASSPDAPPSPPSRTAPPRSSETPPRPSSTAEAIPDFPNWKAASGVSRAASTNPLPNAASVFQEVSRSVWMVVAATSPQDFEESKNVALGSSVAVSEGLLLTNCHIVERRPLVFIKQGGAVERVQVIAADMQTDRCLLSSPARGLAPAMGIRKYSELKVGEEVFTVGAPSGLELTLGQGIISGLRNPDGRRLIQTTAQISPGSSGGGLFDRYGNLVGITTFGIRGGYGLHFAISAEDYLQ